MKKALPFVLVLVAFRGHAQAPLPAAPPTHADSVAILRQVFRHARRHARFGAGASGLVLGAQALSFASDRTTGSPARLALGVSVSALYTYFLADRGWIGDGSAVAAKKKPLAVWRRTNPSPATSSNAWCWPLKGAAEPRLNTSPHSVRYLDRRSRKRWHG